VDKRSDEFGHATRRFESPENRKANVTKDELRSKLKSNACLVPPPIPDGSEWRKAVEETVDLVVKTVVAICPGDIDLGERPDAVMAQLVNIVVAGANLIAVARQR
jgi:hypothetical protein